MIGQILLTFLAKILSEHGLAVAQAVIKKILERLNQPVPTTVSSANAAIPMAVLAEVDDVIRECCAADPSLRGGIGSSGIGNATQGGSGFTGSQAPQSGQEKSTPASNESQGLQP